MRLIRRSPLQILARAVVQFTHHYSPCTHQKIMQFHDVYGKISVISRWCSRSSRAAPVWRNAVYCLPPQSLNYRRAYPFCRLLLQTHTNQETALSVGQRQQYRTARHTGHGVGIPVANAFPCLCLCRTLRQRIADGKALARGLVLAPANPLPAGGAYGTISPAFLTIPQEKHEP